MKFAAACLPALAAVFLAAVPAAAQQPRPEGEPRSVEQRTSVDDVIQRSGIIEALEALAAAAAPEIERTAELLGQAVAGLATRLAEDQELRTSAARAAHGMVGVAEIMVVEQSATLLEALREAAAHIEGLSRKKAEGEPNARP
ncbi:MAG TPA: hypothetical protein VK929_09835 [Longimicrobiales bacterium]|nr:hypothetical protein [Longimicrobiales bacterium]